MLTRLSKEDKGQRGGGWRLQGDGNGSHRKKGCLTQRLYCGSRPGGYEGSRQEIMVTWIKLVQTEKMRSDGSGWVCMSTVGISRSLGAAWSIHSYVKLTFLKCWSLV